MTHTSLSSTQPIDPEAVDFCTLGMFIIDDIDFLPPKESVKNIIGGAGSYAAIGARLLSPPPISRRVGWTVHCGSDFPDAARATIKSWQTACHILDTPDRLTTRGWNGYGKDEHRAFKYLTPKIRLTYSILPTSFLFSSSFHLICSSSRCIEEVTNILISREKSRPGSNNPRPIFVWEPVPDLCIESELDLLCQAARLCDVTSPNHQEMNALFGILPNAFTSIKQNDGTNKSADDPEEDVNCDEVESQALSLLDIFTSSSRSDAHSEKSPYPLLPDGSPLPLPTRCSVIVRAGKEGSFTASALVSSSSSVNRTSKPDITKWLPAYHTDASKVVDPTGAGNTFLGALCISQGRGDDLISSVLKATVAASFAIEQIGMPNLNKSEVNANKELWNNDSVTRRIEDLQNRIRASC